MRMTANNNNYNHFVDFFLVPIYNKIMGTLIPRLFVSCKDCIQLGSQIQLVDWFFMEDYIVLRFYGFAVELHKLPMHAIEMVFLIGICIASTIKQDDDGSEEDILYRVPTNSCSIRKSINFPDLIPCGFYICICLFFSHLQ